MKKLLIGLFTISILYGFCHAQEVESVSFDGRADYDTVLINLSSPAEPKVFALKNPDRIVVDFNGAFWSGGKKETFVKSDRVSSVRWAQNSVNPDNVRVVIDLLRPVEREIISKDGGKQVTIKIKGEAETENAAEIKEEIVEVKKDANLVVPSDIISLDESGREKIDASIGNPEEIEPISEEVPLFNKKVKPSLQIKLPPLKQIGKFSVVVNGKKTDFGKKNIFIRNVLMVPAKDLFSLLGYSFVFDPKTISFTARLSDEVEAVIEQGAKTFSVNGFDRPLQASAQKISGRFYVPFVSVIKWVGLGIVWDKASRTVFAAPRVTRISWEEKYGTKSVVIESTSQISTYEALQREKPLLYIVTMPNFILDVERTKISVKEEGIIGIKAFQDRGNIKIGVYLESKQISKILLQDKQMAVVFPPNIKSIGFTEEATSIKILISATKPITFETRRLSDPERIIIDIPGTIYNAAPRTDIDKDSILRVRASQFKIDPFVSRIVVDLSKDTAYKADLSEDNRNIVLRIKKEAEEKERVVYAKPKKIKELKGKIIIVDPGHGGSDPGAFGYSGESVAEKNLTLSTAAKLAKLLSEAGAVPLLSREDDVAISLQGRVDFAKNNSADALICMHYNSSDRRNISGTETYYYNDNSRLLASLVHKSMLSELGRADRKLSKVKFYVVYKAPMPAVLVEPLYLNNEEEEKLALDPNFQEKIAKSIFDGIKKYFEVLKRTG